MDSGRTVEDIMKVLAMQEDILQFSHFTNADALELGRQMTEDARKKKLPVAISIRRSNGLILYQTMADGVNLDNAAWLDRKFNTVNRVEVSSLSWFMLLKKNDQTMADKLLDENVFACCGGGFPIRLEDSEVVGAVLVSGMNHVQDHDFIIRSLSKYLHMDEVPRIETLAP